MIPLSTPPGAKIVAIGGTSGEGPNLRAGETYTLRAWHLADAGPLAGEACVEVAELDHAPVVRRRWFRRPLAVRWFFGRNCFRLPVTLESLMDAKAPAEGPLRRRRKVAHV